MKINGYDIDLYLKGIKVAESDYDLDRQGSILFSDKKPSEQKRHVKNPIKLKQALRDVNDGTDCNLYSVIKRRWEKQMDQPMTYYRGYTKTAKEIFAEVDKMSKAFDEMGLERSNQIVACMSNTPEVLVLLLAASRCGLIVNFIGADFSTDYIEMIFKRTPLKKLFIGTDDIYGKIAGLVKETGFKDKVIVSLVDSLTEGFDKYEKFDEKICPLVDRVLEFKKTDRDIMSYYELLNISEYWDSHDNGYAKRTFYSGDDALDAALTITYTIPVDSYKILPIVHSNKSYIAMARYSDKDLFDRKAMDGMRSLAHMPTFLNANLSTCIINEVAHGNSIAFEPISNPKFLLYSMAINKPNIFFATRSTLIEVMKQAELNPEFAEYGFSNAVIVSSILEDVSKGEEKYINDVLRNINAGSEVLPLVISSTKLSVSAGDLEHGNIFFTPYKALHERFSFGKSVRENYGLSPLQAVDLAVLDEAGGECGYEEYGLLVVNSDCTMLGYLSGNDNKKLKLMDNEGKIWGDCKVYGAVLKNGNVLVRGSYNSAIRLENFQKVPYFMIADKLMEQDGVMSCEVVKPKDRSDVLVAHIGFHPEEIEAGKERIDSLLCGVETICQESLAFELAEKIVYKVRPYTNSFPLTKMRVRSNLALENEGIEDCYKPSIIDGKVVMVSAKEYLNQRKDKPIQFVKKED